MATSTDSFYESRKAISEYLLFHYGDASEFLLPEPFPSDALEFPQRCAELALRHSLEKGRALDLGCAVGRSAFELSAHFDKTIGIDFSHGLVNAARNLRKGETLEAEIVEEGDLTRSVTIQAPSRARLDRVHFQQGDAMRLPAEIGSFDFVLMANLIDRLPDPKARLASIDSHINREGILAITSPYTWLEEYTPKDKWLGGFLRDGKPLRTHEALQEILSPSFEELESLNLPFLIREHSRKNQLSVAQATLWRKR